jgi:hypothetical protein
MGVNGQLHTPAALPPQKELRYRLDRRLGGSQSRSGRYGEENDLALTGNRAPAVEPIAYSYTNQANLTSIPKIELKNALFALFYDVLVALNGKMVDECELERIWKEAS